MKRFLCIKDVVMDGTGEKAYFKGKVYISEKDGCITNESGFIGHSWSSMVNEYFLELTPELIRQLAQMQPQPQLPVIETGVLNIPEGYYFNCANSDCFTNNQVIDLVKRPELKPFCKDIKTEVDYSKIPVGSVVKCQHKGRPIDKVFICTKYENEIFTTSEGLSVDVNNYQNFQILQLPKQSNGETIQKD